MKSLLLVFLSLLIPVQIFTQTTITVSGKVTNENNNPIISNITINQLLGNTWEYRSEGSSDNNGDFSITLDNITSVESGSLSSLSYLLNGSQLFSPHKTEGEIKVYNLLGEEVSSRKIELLSGSNEIKNDLGNLANSIYIRSIHLQEGIITQKIVKQGNVLNYGTAGINNLSINLADNLRLQKLSSDSLYILTIAAKAGFLFDTNITAVSKTNPSDISGMDLRLRGNDSYVNFQFGWWSVHPFT